LENDRIKNPTGLKLWGTTWLRADEVATKMQAMHQAEAKVQIAKSQVANYASVAQNDQDAAMRAPAYGSVKSAYDWNNTNTVGSAAPSDAQLQADRSQLLEAKDELNRVTRVLEDARPAIPGVLFLLGPDENPPLFTVQIQRRP
jgi:ribosomal protein RSM22 (predicted rRNA methylase)